jgi:uncharacterized protein (DUF1778 family)
MPRDYRLQVRLSEEERKILEKAAKKDGIDLSSWLRKLALDEAKRRSSA